jgi:small-conductance mechanosensitive channel
VFWLMAWILVLQQARVDTDNLWTTLMTIAAMVAIGFIAVWSLLSNLVASVLILATRLFKPRDDIELMDTPGGVSVRGTVRSVDMMFTTVEERREDGTTALLKVPNNLFFQKVVRIRG